MATLTFSLASAEHKVNDAEIIGRRWSGYTAIAITGLFKKMPRIVKDLKYIVSNADPGCAFTLTDSSITSATKTDAIPERVEITDTWLEQFKDAVYRDVDSWSVSGGVVTFTKKS